jgi:hypothetical protein
VAGLWLDQSDQPFVFSSRVYLLVDTDLGGTETHFYTTGFQPVVSKEFSVLHSRLKLVDSS